jgi:hypothetical protein
LLVITYHYPPDGAVGGLRWAGLTRGLAALGWSSWVVTAAQGDTPATPGVTVVRVPRRTTLNDRYLNWRAAREAQQASQRRAQGSPPGGASPGSDPGASPARRVISIAGMFLSLPDIGRGWVLRAASAARELIRTVNPSVVLTSGPPHSAHVAGWMACRGGGPPRFVDLRDPITWPDPHLLSSAVTRRLEALSVSSATGVLCVTKEVAADIARRYPTTPVRHVPNGVDLSSLLLDAEPQPLPGLSIAHVGTIYLGRDPSVALRAVRTFLDARPDAARDTRLRLAGTVEAQLASRVTDMTRELRLNGTVELLGTVERSRALDLLRRSRLVLVFAQGQAKQIPAKLYEAAAMGQNVVVVTETDSPSAAVAREFGLAVVTPDDYGTLAQILERVWKGEEVTPRRIRDLSRIDHRTIARELSDILEPAG